MTFAPADEDERYRPGRILTRSVEASGLPVQIRKPSPLGQTGARGTGRRVSTEVGGAVTSEDAGRPAIIVGVDGSDDSREALLWAVRQARLTGAEVHALTAWQVPFSIYLAPSATEADYEQNAAETLSTAVQKALGPDPGVPVIAQLVQKRPAAALTEAAEGAELLVVGAHGRGELPGMHLGSVATYCVHHAPCPVTVVCERRVSHA